MSPVKKSNVQNHLSLRNRTHIQQCRPKSQADATGFPCAESGTVQSGPSLLAEDFVVEHSSSGKSIAQTCRVIGPPAALMTTTLKSTQA